jgi:23S rRNA (uridine2552-2'-O)-methyltransferase
MAKSSSSARWRSRQEADPYVRRAAAEGWRSRAVFKLQEMDERDRLLRPGLQVVDLGAAPGGWSQYAASRIGPSGRIVAADLLPMDAIPGVTCIRGDFADETILQEIVRALEGRKADMVMSDMAPNLSGNRSIDQPRAMLLAELALDLVGRVLAPGGIFVTTLCHGEGFDEYVRGVREQFGAVRVRKPAASRPASRETYLVARTYRL